MKQMKLLIVDDHPLVRSGIRLNLAMVLENAEIQEAGSPDEAIAVLEENEIDVIVLDLRLEDRSGLDVARYVAERGLATQCVVFTSHSNPRAVIAAFDTGSVSAFLEKDMDITPLAEAVSAAGKGLASLTIATVRAAVEEIRSSGGYDASSLTPREESIAELVADGYSDAEISRELHLAGSTVRNNLTNIYRKVGVESRTRLAALIWDARANNPVV